MATKPKRPVGASGFYASQYREQKAHALPTARNIVLFKGKWYTSKQTARIIAATAIKQAACNKTNVRTILNDPKGNIITDEIAELILKQLHKLADVLA